jgi:hypothetical protein
VEYGTDSSFAAKTTDSAVIDTVKRIHNLTNNTTMWWHVRAHNAAGWGSWSAKRKFAVKIPAIPKTYSFKITDKTGLIRYALPKTSFVLLRIFYMNGKLLTTLVNKQQNAGYYELSMKGKIAPGIYNVEFKAGAYYQKAIMILSK